jgi:hypothetical protein
MRTLPRIMAGDICTALERTSRLSTAGFAQISEIDFYKATSMGLRQQRHKSRDTQKYG